MNDESKELEPSIVFRMVATSQLPLDWPGHFLNDKFVKMNSNKFPPQRILIGLRKMFGTYVAYMQVDKRGEVNSRL
jgi:hypothetical protein